MASCGVRTERGPSFYLTVQSFSGSINGKSIQEKQVNSSDFTVVFFFILEGKFGLVRLDWVLIPANSSMKTTFCFYNNKTYISIFSTYNRIIK